MDLRTLISPVPVRAFKNGPTQAESLEITSLAYDSRQAVEGSLFFAVEGEATDGHKYIDEALCQGAVALVSERPPQGAVTCAWVQVDAIRPAMAIIANRFYREPSRELQLAGITGTNGKTTTAFLIHSVLSLRQPALLMGTIKTLVGERESESRHTTPEAVDIQRTLREARDASCEHGVMEVSSHALSLHRVYRCRFPVALFTNLTQDHLDFHQTLEHYLQAKMLLFDPAYNPGLRHSLVNGDDPATARIEFPSLFRFGLRGEYEIRPLEHRTSFEGTEMTLAFFGRQLRLTSSLVGGHNLYNLMSAAGVCSLLGFEDGEIQEGIARLRQVPGRFERVEVQAPFSVVVDYAHTPDALDNVIRLAREVTNGRIICVFGCGGDRDRRKRPIMGSIAAQGSDLAIVTSDNPRSEEPEAIISEIVAGIDSHRHDYEVVVDRRQAIKRAVEIAQPGDVVLIAGKGHETYQIIKGQKSHFDDREVAKEFL
jgi:UDP-N-acetylmuramoyl-L-alanyl-D-glutamate--2,6-diaminopimelate ligase